MNFLDYNSDSDSDTDDHVIEFNHGTSSTIVITPGVSSNSNIIPPSVSGSGVSSLLGSSSSQPYSSQLNIGHASTTQRIDPSSLVSPSQSHHPQPPQPQPQPQSQPQPGLSLAELASIAAAKRAKEQEEENKKKEQSSLVSVSASLLSMYNDDDDHDHDHDGQDSNDESTENTLDMDGNPITHTQKHKRAKTTTGALSSDGSDDALVQLDSTTTTSITNDNNDTHNDNNNTNNSNNNTSQQQEQQQQQQKKRRKTRTRLEDEFKNANIIRITHNDLTQRTKEEEIYAELHRKFNIGHHQKHIQSTMWDGVHGKEVVVDKASDAAKRKNQITVAAAKAERIQRDREFQRAYSQAIKRLHYEEQLKKSSSSSSL